MELHSSVFLIKVEFTCNIILASGVQHRDFPEGTVVKKKKKKERKPPANAGDIRNTGSISRLERFPG